jgi:hypothetical protein
VVIYGCVVLILCNRIISMFLGLRDTGIKFDSVTQNHFDGVFYEINCTQYIDEQAKLYINCQSAEIFIGSLHGAVIGWDLHLGHFFGRHYHT